MDCQTPNTTEATMSPDPTTTQGTTVASASADNLTKVEIIAMRNIAADAISKILNNFSEKTGLKIESVDLNIAVIYGGPQQYSVTLDVRL